MSFGGLYISISGIHANKKALDTLSHNIANVNNPNYVRQQVIHADSRYSKMGLQFQTGTGVDVQQVRQIRDEFLDFKLRREMATFGYYYTKSEVLEEIEYIFREMKIPGELNSGALQDVMNDFWDSWDELSKDSESLTIRGLLHENAVAFTTTVNHISTQLDDLQFNLNKEMLSKSNEVNTLLREMADLNKNIKIQEAYSPRVRANDLRDSRNAKLDRLAELIPINYYENHQGEIAVTLQGRDLINGDYFNPIEVRLNEKGHGEIHWSDTGEKINLQAKGELGGYIDARDKEVVEYRNRLNIMVNTLADEINKVHIKGKGLDGSTDILFFEFEEDDPAATLRVNPELADFNKIAAASILGARGDGEIAKEIYAIRKKGLYGKYDPENPGELIEPKNLTLDDFYRDLILNLGTERQEAREMSSNQIMLIQQIDERRQEISSVSLDEEMANMLKYQHSYIANSRVVNAIDEMIDNIVNRMGIVGR
jgi:flagellar hook-associated protein 1 FlgK